MVIFLSGRKLAESSRHAAELGLITVKLALFTGDARSRVLFRGRPRVLRSLVVD
jgi:hypothetical protein